MTMQEPQAFLDRHIDILPSLLEVFVMISCTVSEIYHPSDNKSSLSLLG
jgi:hypothetical protein